MYVPRELRARFEKLSRATSIIALVGARQAGKTTFLREHAKGMDCSYILFDDPDARAVFDDDVKRFESQYVEGHEISILDEVQYCRDAGMKLKYLADRGHRIWMTSSSEMLLSKDILSYLVGRVSILRMYPFSLQEFLEAKSLKTARPAIIRRCVWEHMLYGGYPKIVITEDTETKKMLLNDLREIMMLKDVARAFSIEDMRSLEDFARHTASTASEVASYESMSMKIGISFRTLIKYIDAMEKSYLISRVQPFFRNKLKEIAKRPKLYFVDMGIRNAVLRNFPAEPDGKAFENYVFTELLKMGLNPKYWRSKAGAEVDFVVEKGGKPIPIEVKLKVNRPIVERGLRSFIDAYRPKKALVVSYKGPMAEVNMGGCRVSFVDVIGMKPFL
jgi:hypothetical protein